MSALLSFLGGSAFRMLFGEISAAWTKYQDHRHEVEMMALQADLEDRRHKRELEMQENLARLGIKRIEAKADADIAVLEAEAWEAGVNNLSKRTGIVWLDVMRGLVQPILAYIAIMIWVMALNAQHWTVTDWDKELVSAIFGLYLANRHLSARGK